MGAITDGSFRDVAKSNKEYRAQYTRMYGGGYETHSPFGSLLTSFSTQAIWTIAEKLEARADKPEEEIDETETYSAAAESLRQDIQAELNANGCSNISEVQVKLQTTQAEYETLNLQFTSKNNELSGINGDLKNLANLGLTQEEYDNRYKELTAKGEALSKELETLKPQLEAKKKEAEQIADSLSDLLAYQKQLKKIVGRDAIEELTNDETKKFSNSLNDLKKAIASGNEEKINSQALKVKKAYEEFTAAHPDNKNKTMQTGYEFALKYIKDEQQA